MTVRDLIFKVRFSYVITDPFPDHTEYNWKIQCMSAIDKFFGAKNSVPKPREISIWEAYRLGQQAVYDRLDQIGNCHLEHDAEFRSSQTTNKGTKTEGDG